MRLTSKLTTFALWGAFTFIPFGFTACTSPEPGQAGSQDQQTSTQHGADHSAGMSHDMTSMDLGPADETFDLRFIDAMTLHHEGAVAMAEEALEKSNRDQIKQLAQEIITAQQQEIEQMQQWRQAWYLDAGSEPVVFDAQMGHSMPMSESQQSSMMMNPELGAADAEFDLRFLEAMIPHHQGALTMAQAALEKSDRPEIQQLAEAILGSQQPEIDQMQQWRQEWYGQ